MYRARRRRKILVFSSLFPLSESRFLKGSEPVRSPKFQNFPPAASFLKRRELSKWNTPDHSQAGVATRHACTQIFSISEFEFQINQHAVEMLTLVQCVQNLYISGIPHDIVESAYQCNVTTPLYLSLLLFAKLSTR